MSKKRNKNKHQEEKKSEKMSDNFLDIYDIYKELLGNPRAKEDSSSVKSRKADDLANEFQELQNAEFRQYMNMKRLTLYILFSFLAVETFIIFLFTFFQATRFHDFKLEEWSFKLLITATISQITIMLIKAVKHLFPETKR